MLLEYNKCNVTDKSLKLDPNLVNFHGKTVFMLAMKSELPLSIAKLFLRYFGNDLDITAVDLTTGKTSLMYLLENRFIIESEFIGSVSLILSRLNTITSTSSSRATGSSSNSTITAISDFLNQQAFENGWTALHILARSMHHSAGIKQLIDLGANVNIQSLQGFTPLQLATTFHTSNYASPQLETIKMLVEHGKARLDLRNHKGSTAFDIAMSNRDNILVHYLASMQEIKPLDEEGEE